MPAPGLVRDPGQRDRVERVVEHLEVRDQVLDFGPLVEARAADHLVGDSLADQDVFQNARLCIRPVEDRDLVGGVALLDEPGDLGGDEPRLGVLVLGLDHVHRPALAELRPEILLLALAVVLDDLVRGPEDRVRGSVVLFEGDRLRGPEFVLEFHDVADIGTAPSEDRLIRVADDHQVPVLAGEQLEQAVLGVVRVLVLVDEHVPEGLLPALARLGEALQHLDREHQHVVEVDRVRGEHPLLVELVHLGDGLVVERRDALHVLVRADQLVLCVRDLGVDAARDEALRVALELLQALLDEPDLVGLVVDREVRPVAEPRRLAAEDPAAGRVEGEDPDRTSDVAEEVLEAGAHLLGGLVGEGDREDLVRLHAAGRDQVGDAVGEHSRLAGARAGDHEQGAFGREHGLLLDRVQVREVFLRLRDGHAADASGAGRASCRARGRRPPRARELVEVRHASTASFARENVFHSSRRTASASPPVPVSR